MPAVDTRVSLPFSSIQAMSAAGTLKAVEVLRREIQVAAATGKAESMNSIRVVVVDVGSVDTGRTHSTKQDNPLKATERWTANERLIYGPAFISSLQGDEPISAWDSITSLFDEDRRYSVSRRPASASAFVDKIVAAVSGGHQTGPSICGHNIGLGYVQNWLRGDRFAVGAGALTYRMASYLPSLLLDGLLNLPYYLIGLRNRLLPTQPFRRPPRSTPRSRHASGSPAASPPPRAGGSGVRAIEASPKDTAAAEDVVVPVETEELEIETPSTTEGLITPSESDSGDVAHSWVSLNREPAGEDPAINDPSFVA